MIKGYQSLRRYCHDHEWAAGLSAALLLAILGLCIFLSLEYQTVIWQWLSSSLLVNGLIMVSVMLLAGSFSVSLLCLSFCPCSQQDRTEMVTYRHRPVLSESLEMIRNLGGNPKRRRKQARSVSS